MSDIQETRALYPEAFRAANENLKAEPLAKADVVIWNECGTRLHKRTFTVVGFYEDGGVAIAGWPDGHTGERVMRVATTAELVREEDMFSAVWQLRHERGLCDCPKQPADAPTERSN